MRRCVHQATRESLDGIRFMSSLLLEQHGEYAAATEARGGRICSDPGEIPSRNVGATTQGLQLVGGRVRSAGRVSFVLELPHWCSRKSIGRYRELLIEYSWLLLATVTATRSRIESERNYGRIESVNICVFIYDYCSWAYCFGNARRFSLADHMSESDINRQYSVSKNSGGTTVTCAGYFKCGSVITIYWGS